jgi:4-nitrophenyl phosphatase
MKKDWVENIKGIILDMDGVLWRGDEPIGNLPKLFSKISDYGLKVVLATNNSTKSVDQYLQKLASYGVHLESWQIVNSSIAVVEYLKKLYPDGGNVFVIGEDGLFNTLAQENYLHHEQQAVAVVVGLDREVTYHKLMVATKLIRSGAAFIGTNSDSTLPTPFGLIPGAGSLLAAIEAATDVKPFVVGKPAAEIYQIALDRMQLQPNQTLVVGDRIETDIVGAQNLGCMTGLVLSGVTNKEMVEQCSPLPNLIENDLSDILQALW